MVSNASDDLPEPLTPVKMTSLPCGSVTSTFFRLWVRAPRTMSGLRAGCLGVGILWKEFPRKRKREMVLPRFCRRKRRGVSPHRYEKDDDQSDRPQQTSEIEQRDSNRRDR